MSHVMVQACISSSMRGGDTTMLKRITDGMHG